MIFLTSRKTVLLFFFTIFISSATFTSWWQCCCWKPEPKTSEHSSDLSQIITGIPFEHHNQTELLVRVTIVSLNQDTPSIFDTHTRALAIKEIKAQEPQQSTPSLPTSTSMMNTSKAVQEYKKNKKLISEQLKEQSKNLPTEIPRFLDEEIEEPFLQHLEYRKILQEHLPLVGYEVTKTIESLDATACCSQKEQAVLEEIKMFAKSCDPEHLDIIILWLTSFFKDELREKRIISEYVTSYFKQEFCNQFYKSKKFKPNQLESSRRLFLYTLTDPDTPDTCFKRRAIRKYLKKYPLFERAIIDIFDRLFIYQCDPTL